MTYMFPDWHLLQLATKGVEMVAKQLGFNPRRFRSADYLPYMYHYDTHFFSEPPREVVSYETLWNPLDGRSWAFLLASVAAVLVTMIVIEKTWHLTTGTHSSRFCYFESKHLIT